jgi:hypothetical protein
MKLLILTPCEKVIQDQTSGPSLIATFQEFGAVIPTAADLPVDAVLPKEWCIFVLWELQPEERDRQYFVRTQIAWPDGKDYIDTRFLLRSVADKAYMSSIQKISGFPIGQNGTLHIKIWLELDGSVVFAPATTSILVTVSRNDAPFTPVAQASA